MQEAQVYAQENGLFFMETSAKTATNVNDIFYEIGMLLLMIRFKYLVPGKTALFLIFVCENNLCTHEKPEYFGEETSCRDGTIF